MIILRPLCPACQTRTMLARVTPGPVRHPDVRMPCVQTRPSDCGRTTNRPDEVPQNEHMASRTASADVKATSLAASLANGQGCPLPGAALPRSAALGAGAAAGDAAPDRDLGWCSTASSTTWTASSSPLAPNRGLLDCAKMRRPEPSGELGKSATAGDLALRLVGGCLPVSLISQGGPATLRYGPSRSIPGST